jgi:NDP-sugar pyrophosphorylase family protein
MHSLIIVAAGNGSRMGSIPIPKALFPINGKPNIEWIIESARGYKHLYITADSYNSAIYQWFVRAEAGKSPGMFSDWPDIYKNFKPIGQKTIYYTEQYVVEYKNEYSKLGQIN